MITIRFDELLELEKEQKIMILQNYVKEKKKESQFTICQD